jgi:hypothetical protein
MNEDLPSALAERTGRLLEDVNLQVERFDAADERTAFLGYVGHADDAGAVLSKTARPVVAAFASVLATADWPDDVYGLVLRAYDPTEPKHDREGALEWEVSTAVARRYALAAEGESDAAGDGDDAATDESPAAVVEDAVATARIVYADGRVEPFSPDGD